MCDPITIGLMVAGAAASYGGAGIQAGEAARNANRVAAARNRELQNTNRVNQIHSDANRAAVNQRIDESEKGPADQQLQQTQGQQVANIQSNVGPTATEFSLAGDAPQIVKSAFAKSVADASATSMDRAKATGNLGAYRTTMADNAIGDNSLRDNINMNNDSVRGNLSLLPHLQDFAEIKATKPSSGLGEIISALGQAASMYAGSRGTGAKIPSKPAGAHPIFGYGAPQPGLSAPPIYR